MRPGFVRRQWLPNMAPPRVPSPHERERRERHCLWASDEERRRRQLRQRIERTEAGIARRQAVSADPRAVEMFVASLARARQLLAQVEATLTRRRRRFEDRVRRYQAVVQAKWEAERRWNGGD